MRHFWTTIKDEFLNTFSNCRRGINKNSSQYKKGLTGYMIIITKDEAMALMAKYGDDANVTITSRHKKGGRKKYYAAEERRNLFFLERYRSKRARNCLKKREG